MTRFPFALFGLCVSASLSAQVQIVTMPQPASHPPVAITADIAGNVYAVDSTGLRRYHFLDSTVNVFVRSLGSLYTPAAKIATDPAAQFSPIYLSSTNGIYSIGAQGQAALRAAHAVSGTVGSMVVGPFGPATGLWVSYPGRNVVALYLINGGNFSPPLIFGADGTAGYAGDGTSSPQGMRFNQPGALATDSAGDLLISDDGNHVIRQIDQSFVASTIAGTGTAGTGPDGWGSPLASPLGAINGMAQSSSGVVVTEAGTCRLIAVSAKDRYTVAGNGVCAPSSDGSAQPGSPLQSPTAIAPIGQGAFVMLDGEMVRAVLGPSASTVTLTSLPVGASITIDGVSATTPVTRSWSAGSSHSIATATPQTISGTPRSFASWSDGGSISHTVTAPLVNLTNTATFAALQPVPVTVTSVPAGRSVTVDGSDVVAPQTFTWLPGTAHSVSVASPQTLGTTRYVFAGWSDSGTQAHTITAPNTAATYTVSFSTQYQFTTAVFPTGAGTVTAGAFVDAGSAVSLQAAPNAGYTFNQFTGALNSPANPGAFVVNAPGVVVANFTAGPGVSGPVPTYTVSTVAGGPLPLTPVQAGTQTYGPDSVMPDSFGNLYFSSTDGLYRLDPSNQVTLLGGGAITASPALPAALPSVGFKDLTAVRDQNGNFYLADPRNNRVVKVSGNQVTLFAGNGSTFTSGDSGAATAAAVPSPQALALDASGDLYIATDNRIRRVSGGIINTVATTGTTPYCMASGAAGLYYSEGSFLYLLSGNTITKVAGAGTNGLPGDGGDPLAANIHASSFCGMAVDTQGRLYFSEYSNAAVRRIDFSSNVISLVAGVQAGLTTPSGLAFTPTGDLLIADNFGDSIRKVNGISGLVSTVLGPGTNPPSSVPAVGQRLAYPTLIAAAPVGGFYVGTDVDSRIRKVDSNGILTSVAGAGWHGYSDGGGVAANALLYLSSFVAQMAVKPDGTIVVADGENGAIRFITTAGGISSLKPNIAGFSPSGVAVTSSGTVYVSAGSQIYLVSGSSLVLFAGTGVYGAAGDGGSALSAQFTSIYSLATNGASVYAAEAHRIRQIDISTGFVRTIAGSPSSNSTSGDGGPALSAGFEFISAIALDAANNLFVLDIDGQRVRRIAADTGIINTVAGTGLRGYAGDGGPALQAKFGDPFGIAVDSAGNILISDFRNTSVRKLSASTLVTINSNPAGMPITVDGELLMAPVTKQWISGTSHSVSAEGPVTSGGSRYVFGAWSDSGAQSHLVTASGFTSSFTANYALQHLLQTNVNPASAGTVAGGGWYTAGAAASLTAAANAGYDFAYFSGSASGSVSPLAVNVTGPMTVAANFTTLGPTLSALITGKSGVTSPRIWTVSLTNTGAGAASSAALSGLSLTQTAGASCTPIVQTALPSALGAIPPGGSASGNISINFGACVATARFTVSISFTGGAGYSGVTNLTNQIR